MSFGGSDSTKHMMHPTPPPLGQVKHAKKNPLRRLTSTVPLSFSKGEDKLVPIKAKVDTGSSTTMVTESMYVAYLSHIVLKLPAKCSEILVSY